MSLLPQIQGFDVRYDGKGIVFSMRTNREQGFQLYEIRLDDSLNYIEGSFTQISFCKRFSIVSVLGGSAKPLLPQFVISIPI